MTDKAGTPRTLEISRRSWTASVSPKSSWEAIREATEAECAVADMSPGGQFWLTPEGSCYAASSARSNIDQLVRVRPA